MPNAHKEQDLRNCGATTISQGQSFVTISDKKWAVENDPDSHGGGGLIASKSYVTINGKKVIVDGDNANPDNARHMNPKAVSPTGFVEVN